MNYRDGGEGMVRWCEDHIHLPIYYPFDSRTAKWTLVGDLPDTPHPVTSKSYKNFWIKQTNVLKNALEMEKGEFKYKLIIFCWMRGEGKSLITCLIQLWKFFNWPRQQIVLGANSKDQVKFVHFEIMKDIILNSPKLRRYVGERNIQEKEIRLADSKGKVKSTIRAISSFSGIVSNVTGYTFSEMFDMKKPKFFVQLDGSIRAIPNSLGTIDSTVSAKDHILYELYQSHLENKVEGLYYSYRYSEFADVQDYWNPNMDQKQLNDYRAKFPFGEFERYFLNMWSAGAGTIFTDKMIEEIGIIGCQDSLFNHYKISEILDSIQEHKDRIKKYEKDREQAVTDRAITIDDQILFKINNAIKTKQKELVKVDEFYQLHDGQKKLQLVPAQVLEKLGDILDTDWAILVGLDFSDPMSITSRARTILSITAKGLIGSRSNPSQPEFDVAPKYIYLLLYLNDIADHSISRGKNLIDEAIIEYDGVDTVCSERYGAWDIKEWCEDKQIFFEPVFPNYARQKDAYKEFYNCLDTGRFKAPYVPLSGSKKEDILREELEVFEHQFLPGKTNGWFGSPEKNEKNGVQDDCLYSIVWGIYGGRFTTYLDFRPRKGRIGFGEMVQPKHLVGDY